MYFKYDICWRSSRQFNNIPKFWVSKNIPVIENIPFIEYLPASAVSLVRVFSNSLSINGESRIIYYGLLPTLYS